MVFGRDDHDRRGDRGSASFHASVVVLGMCAIEVSQYSGTTIPQ
jgi:hypothetical protein